MTETDSSAAAPNGKHQGRLDANLGFACHAIRLVAIAWIAFAVYAVASVWSDPPRVAGVYGRLLKLDLAGYSSTQYAASLAIVLADLALSTVVAVLIWRLFGHFLAGRILDIATVDVMRRLGWVGLAALLFDIATRPVVAAILSAHIGGAGRRFDFWGQPNDLLHIMMALFVIVVASALRVGVLIADEHRQIV